MSYINPDIYKEEYLTEDEQDEIRYWRDVFINAAENVIADYDEDTIIGRMQKETVQEAIEQLRENFEASVRELIVSFIDGRE